MLFLESIILDLQYNSDKNINLTMSLENEIFLFGYTLQLQNTISNSVHVALAWNLEVSLYQISLNGFEVENGSIPILQG